MKIAWYDRDPALLRGYEEEIEHSFPGLRLVLHEGKVIAKGRFDVYADGKIYDSYSISIHFLDGHPQSLPLVFEEGGKIPKIADRHVNIDGSACLFVFFERKKYWSNPRSLTQFLGGAVNAYFYSQSYYSKNGTYPFGERNHDVLGVLEAIQEHSGVESLEHAVKVVRLLEHKELKGHWSCPCGRGKALRECHGPYISELKKILSPDDAKSVMNRIKEIHKEWSTQRQRDFNVLGRLGR
ncbi:hypothetical protein ACNQKP_02525 [Bdellovibrio bacteriovorus]|uniref:hypothetical protein n=1 Tax=Bdellovibrio bacteriovorus TaxID=959 RepID=UPI003AA849B5